MHLNVVASANAKSFYMIESTYKDKKHSTRIVEKLGTETELRERLGEDIDLYEWARTYIAQQTRLEKEGKRLVRTEYNPQRRIERESSRVNNAGYLFLQSIYYSLKLHELCREIADTHRLAYDMNAILERLVYTRILYPASKRSSYKSSSRFLEAVTFSQDDVYLALDQLEKQSASIQAHVYQHSKALCERNTAVLYYDCTNYYFETEEADGFRQYGKSKEHRPNPIVQMGLFMDGGGIPLGFEMSGGAKNEQLTLHPLEQRIMDDFALSKFIVCTDGGLGSMANRMFNDAKDRAFVVTQSLKKLEKSLMEWSLDPQGWRLSGSHEPVSLKSIEDTSENSFVYYKSRKLRAEVNCNGEKSILEQTLFVTYSPKYKAYQQHVREGQIERARCMALKPGVVSKRNPNDPARFISVTPCTQEGEIATDKVVSLNQEAIDKEAAFDGFYGVCTNLDDDFDTIMKINQGRWEIEESFRILKTEFRARPAYLRRENRIKAHFLTCFLALVIYRLLEHALHARFTVSQIVDTLREMNLICPREGVYHPAYTRTALTDALHDAFGFNTDWEVLSNKKLLAIQKRLKSARTLLTF